MDKEAKQLLPWYVNGTLAGAERDRVEAELRLDGNANSQLEWERTVQAAIKADPAFDVPDDRGLFQTMQRIRGGAKVQAAQARAVQQGGRSAGFTSWFRWSPALALACGVVAVQFAVIGQMWMVRHDESEFAASRAVATAPPKAADTFIRIAFKPDSTEGDLNALLRAIHAEIVSGPSQLGDYYLLVDPRSAQNALTVLQSDAHVESAELVNALPARH